MYALQPKFIRIKDATLSVERRRSAAFALQDHLNEHDEALWGLVTNGNTIRLMRDNASLTRPAYIEANIAQIFDTEDMASFAALWLLIHRSRFGNAGEPATDCALERWRDAGTREGEVARVPRRNCRDQPQHPHRAGVPVAQGCGT
jgi:hypothetical protein